ncbi:MAG: DNA alkylation repair protein [Bacteroidetes bacterium]|nr:DNA alkylation repair protein [Bacteroidota bacterium]
MTLDEVMVELESFGKESHRKIYQNHGANVPVFGVPVGDMKKIQKKIKKNHELSLQLFNTGNGDAMYFAGLIADEKQITKEDLENWARSSTWYMTSEYTVPWVTAESSFALELGLKWIDDPEENVQTSGWSTLSSWISITPDEEIDKKLFSALLDRVEKSIHSAKNRVRYTMNAFVISVGSYIPDLTEKALNAGKNIGKVQVEMGGTACKVPVIPDYIKKVADKGYIGKKRKEARC